MVDSQSKAHPDYFISVQWLKNGSHVIAVMKYESTIDLIVEAATKNLRVISTKISDVEVMIITDKALITTDEMAKIKGVVEVYLTAIVFWPSSAN